MDLKEKEELKAHLMATNEEFRRLAEEHSQHARRLEALESLPRLSTEQEIEEHRLKKLKLRLKDQMEAILTSYYRAQHVA